MIKLPATEIIIKVASGDSKPQAALVLALETVAVIIAHGPADRVFSRPY
jgi:hypothetical protein